MDSGTNQPEFLQREDGPALAFCRFMPDQAYGPTVVFLGGFRSDMQGSKALYLDESCRKRDQPFIRFDYSGHGQSAGDFEQGAIGVWFQDALAVVDQLTTGPLVLAGSSMGGWISLLVARARPARVKAIIGIAAAPDFTKDMVAQMTPAQYAVLMNEGRLLIPNHYSAEPYVITSRLIEDGPQHFLLEKSLDLQIPVKLIQGLKDEDVSWQTALRIKDALNAGGNQDVEILSVEEGSHRLNRPEDLALIDLQVQKVSF